jgi:hypothetical protein
MPACISVLCGIIEPAMSLENAPPARRSAENVNDLFDDGHYNRKHSRLTRNRLGLLPP